MALTHVSNWSTRGINAKKAIDCCEQGKRSTELAIRRVLGLMVDALASAPLFDSFSLGLVAPLALPSVGTSVARPPIVIRIPPGATVVGAVVLVGHEFLNSIGARTAALETAEGLLRAVSTATKTQTHDCTECIKKGVWGQNKKQVKSFGLTRRRSLGKV